MGSVFAVVPRHERSRVRAHARRLRRVAARVPGVSSRLRFRTSVQVAAMAPELATDRLSLLLRHALWSYWLDNRLDAAGNDLAGAARLRAGVTAVTVGDEVCPSDSLLVELARMVCELARYDRGGEVVTWYGKALRDTVAAEFDQVRTVVTSAGARTTAGQDPTAEEYLALATDTVNYRSFAYAMLAAGDDRLAGPQLRCIDSALQRASRAVRLANDVRSLVRDDSTGTLNVLRLRTAAGEAVTTRSVWVEVRRQVREHDTALRALADRGVVPEASVRALTRSLAQAIRLYRHTDLR